MRIFERDAQQRKLTTIFFPQQPGRVMPSELSDEIILVHPSQPYASGFDLVQSDEIVGAGGSTGIGHATVKTDNYFWLPFAHVEHDDPVDRNLQLQLRRVSDGRLTTIRFEGTVPAGIPVALRRPILIPAGFKLFASASGMAAGQKMTLRVVFLNLLESELAPPF